MKKEFNCHYDADIYNTFVNKIHHADCLEFMGLIPDNYVDLIICDLPYGTTNCQWDSPLNLEALWKRYKSVCRGAIILLAQTPFDKVLGCSNLAQLRYEWIWEKSNATGHLNAKRMPMKAHENVLVFYKELPTYNPIKTSGHIRKTANRKQVDKSPIYGKQQFHKGYDSTERYPRSVIKFPSDKQKIALHPTQKPVALYEYLIRTYTNEGDIVLDNCSGSGSLAIAATNAKRDFICIEKDADYHAASVKRLEAHQRQLKLI